jgi:hypothetical protein
MAADDADTTERDPVLFDPANESPHARRRFTPGTALRCPTCGLTLHAATIQHEHALVFASCCPRCDGPLPPIVASDRAVGARSEPSIYLG